MERKGKILFGGIAALATELQREEWNKVHYTILVDENTFQYCLPTLISAVGALQEASFIEVPVGEEAKTLEVASQVWQTLMEAEDDRNAVLVNLGGGCVSDLGGFVAAGYKRGIRYINVPTTLLAMIDAAIGGKTAINFGGVKNSIGHFYNPEITVLDPVFLPSLPPLEILNGRLEMVKTAAVTHPSLYTSLLDSDAVTKQQIIEVARIKNRVVRNDPYDHGIRKILNFGHTFGHAIEAYTHLPHGIAVGIGMLCEMYLSVHKTRFPQEIYQSYKQWLENHLQSFSIHPTSFTLKDAEALLPLMHHDKKNSAGMLRCVLLQELGAAMPDIPISDNEVRDTLLQISK